MRTNSLCLACELNRGTTVDIDGDCVKEDNLESESESVEGNVLVVV